MLYYCGIVYGEFKLKPQYNYYFNVSKVPKYRQPWLKTNNLPVVSGKWLRPRPYDQRLCEESEILCHEYHFLLLCKRLKAFKSKYISLYFWTKPSMNTSVDLLSSDR